MILRKTARFDHDLRTIERTRPTLIEICRQYGATQPNIDHTSFYLRNGGDDLVFPRMVGSMSVLRHELLVPSDGSVPLVISASLIDDTIETSQRASSDFDHHRKIVRVAAKIAKVYADGWDMILT